MIARPIRHCLGLALLGLTVVAEGGPASPPVARVPSAAKFPARTRADGGSTAIFDNFGPNDSYVAGFGFTVSSQDSSLGTDWDQGDAFTVPADADYTLDKIELAVSLIAGDNVLEVFLMSDNGGEPGSILETFTIRDQMGSFGQANPPISANSTGTVLSAGATYWLIASAPEGGAASTAWNINDQTDRGPHAFRSDLGPWTINNETRGAFRVCATPSTGGPCPLVATLNAIGDHVGGLLAKSTDNKDWQLGLLADLRSYRDSVMKTSASGRELTRLYYRHGAEMTRILKQNPVLAWKTVQVVSRAMPAIRTATKSHNAVELDQELLRHGLQLMTDIERLASDDLRKSLRSVRSLLGQHAVVNDDHVVLNLREANVLRVVAVD